MLAAIDSIYTIGLLGSELLADFISANFATVLGAKAAVASII
jgi:hypothetical protein